MYRYIHKNIRQFSAICDCDFGRKVIYTNATSIDETNIVEELNKALSTHLQNATEIEYLDRYVRGDQPILYRTKRNRPEINNKVVVNIAKFIVDTRTAEMVGEPIQYVLRGKDEKKSEEIKTLNTVMFGESKDYYDTELVRWQKICGTAYRYVGVNEDAETEFGDAPFYLSTEEPTKTFVVYFANTKKPAFSCQIRSDENGNDVYNVYTKGQYFFINNNKEIAEMTANGNGQIPVVEYPNNARRLSDVEITILMTDEINKLTSDRANAVEGFVCSWIKFINCDIDIEKFRQVRDEGFFSVTSNNGAENRSDVDIMSQELNQSEAQVELDDLFEKLLIIQGIANREGNTGGDTGSAVYQRNGGAHAEKISALAEPIFKKSEREMLRIVLRHLKINRAFSLIPSDVDIKITRSKFDNALTKAEVLKMLLDCGIDYTRAIKTVGLFSDPEQVAIESKERMEMLFPTKAENPNVIGDSNEETNN